ncbi:MAG: hypothetical protein ACRDH2_09230, partial [Anaerolineales bacterium]
MNADRGLRMQAMLRTLFQTLERENIPYCLMRDADRLDQLLGSGEVDLLVSASHLGQLRGVLARLGFLGLPSLGYAPHHFFVAYDPETDAWLK